MDGVSYIPHAFDGFLQEPDRTELDGIRWCRLEVNLPTLLLAGVQVVLCDGPDHPLLLERIADTPAAEANRLFYEQLADLAHRPHVTLLRYESDWHPGHEASEFFDVLYLNRRGATLLTRHLALDLRETVATGSPQGPPGHL